MTAVDPRAFVEHVVGLGGLGVLGAVGRDVGADVGEEVGALAGGGDGGAEAGEGVGMFGECVAVQGEGVLFEGGGGEEGFRVKEAGELGDEVLALVFGGAWLAGFPSFSKG